MPEQHLDPMLNATDPYETLLKYLKVHTINYHNHLNYGKLFNTFKFIICNTNDKT